MFRYNVSKLSAVVLTSHQLNHAIIHSADG